MCENWAWRAGMTPKSIPEIGNTMLFCCISIEDIKGQISPFYLLVDQILGERSDRIHMVSLTSRDLSITFPVSLFMNLRIHNTQKCEEKTYLVSSNLLASESN